MGGRWRPFFYQFESVLPCFLACQSADFFIVFLQEKDGDCLCDILNRAGYPARGWSAFGGKTGTVADDGETALKEIAIMEV
jgi:hypothetical protein